MNTATLATERPALALPLAAESVQRNDLAQMPEDYRYHLVRIMAMQAYAERLGAIELGPWMAKAPDYAARRAVGKILADEAYHAFLLYRELEQLGVSEQEAIDIAEGRQGNGPAQASLAGPKEVAAEDNEWADIPLNNMFLDRAGRFMVSNFAQSSYAPWASISKRIIKDEQMHEAFGYNTLRDLVQAADADGRRVLAQKASRWYALGLNFFGPPRSSKTERLRELGLKREDNEQLRQRYRAEVEQLMAEMGASDLLHLEHDGFPYA